MEFYIPVSNFRINLVIWSSLTSATSLDLTDDKSKLIQAMACNKPLSEPMLTHISVGHVASIGNNELSQVSANYLKIRHPLISSAWSSNELLCQGTTWWRHQMETFSALLAICAGNSPATGEFPAQRPATRNFDVFFDLRLNKRLSKQSWGWWPSYLHNGTSYTGKTSLHWIRAVPCFIKSIWCWSMALYMVEASSNRVPT